MGDAGDPVVTHGGAAAALSVAVGSRHCISAFGQGQAGGRGPYRATPAGPRPGCPRPGFKNQRFLNFFQTRIGCDRRVGRWVGPSESAVRIEAASRVLKQGDLSRCFSEGLTAARENRAPVRWSSLLGRGLASASSGCAGAGRTGGLLRSSPASVHYCARGRGAAGPCTEQQTRLRSAPRGLAWRGAVLSDGLGAAACTSTSDATLPVSYSGISPTKPAAMWLGVLGVLSVLGAGHCGKVVRVPFKDCYVDAQSPESIYNFTMLDLWGQRNISLSDYKGKVVLITNVATY